MSMLTKPTKYNIEDSNIALLGSDLEKRVREHAGDTEPAWDDAGKETGLQIWRIEQFKVVDWPKERYGSFYDGDSYILMNTYKTSPDAETLSYDLHFWLGNETSQDEAGTAAYKTVELDDHLHGIPVQYREIQGSESPRLLSYFGRFICLKGGVATGFQHITDESPLDGVRILYRITFLRTSGKSLLLIREVPAEVSSLVAGDVYVLDLGRRILQFQSKGSSPQEKFKAAEFVQQLMEPRKGHSQLVVCDEGGTGVGAFFREFDSEAVDLQPDTTLEISADKPTLYRLSDASGKIVFEPLPAQSVDVHTSDAYILDANSAIYVWIGKESSHVEKRLAGQYAQSYLYEKASGSKKISCPIVKVSEGAEPISFKEALQAAQT